MRVLLIEPDSTTAQAIELMLKSEGINVFTTDLGEEGAELALHYGYDLVLLADQPVDMTGLDCLRTMRAAKVLSPVLFLSGSSDVDRKVKVFSAGADDYLTKPFHKDELVARIRAIVRRSQGHAESVITVGPITVHVDAKVVRVDGEALPLTGKEYQCLELLAFRAGGTVTKENFLNHLYGGMDEPELKIVDVFVCKLRNKLRQHDAEKQIETVWGRGYRLVETPTVREETKKAPVRRSLRTIVLERLESGNATFSEIRDLAPERATTTMRAVVAVLLGEGAVKNIGSPAAAMYQITDGGRMLLSKHARVAA